LFIPLARKFGRRPVYLVSTAVMAAMSFWTAEMTSLGELYGTNILFGLAGATNEAIVQITVSSNTSSHWLVQSTDSSLTFRSPMSPLYTTVAVSMHCTSRWS
jgi:MFS family permease